MGKERGLSSNIIVQDAMQEVKISLSSQIFVEDIKNEENKKQKRNGGEEVTNIYSLKAYNVEISYLS